ncbi:MAG: dihydroorotase family protein [Promethearchaeota archaeon]
MAVHDLKIENGRLILPDRIEEADLCVDNGLISAIIKPGLSRKEKAEAVIDGSGYLILPGLVDVHVHFRDPGYPEKEDFASGSLAAAAGGVTTIADMPNTIPPTTTPKWLEEKIHCAEERCIVDYTFHGGPYLPEEDEIRQETHLASDELPLLDMAKQLIEKGILSFKIYMPHFEYPSIQHLAPLGQLLTIHAEEPSKLSEPTDGSSYAFLASRPPEAEVYAIERLLTEPPQCSFHICHISTAAGFRHILSAQHRGIPVSTEVTPHHLLLTVKDLSEIGPLAKCYPPLRSTADTEALLNACFASQINIIASDHAPHTATEKAGSDADFATAPGGIIGVETALPLLYTKLVDAAEMTLPQLVRMMGYNPAYRFGICNSQWIEKGQLVLGADADIVLFDSKKTYTIRGDELHNKATLTPFEGWKVKGQVQQTLIRGKTIFERDY